MSDDLDLRGIDQRHEPDAQFRAALHRRLVMIVEDTAPADTVEPVEINTIELEPSSRSGLRRRDRWAMRGALAVACAAVLIAIVVIVRSRDHRTSPADTPTPSTSAANGSVTFAALDADLDGDVYVVREGSTPRRVTGSDADRTDEVCPAFSPDGHRLLFGQAAGNQQDGYDGVPALVITSLSPDGVPSETITIPLEGATLPPCAIWSADGRWVAFGIATTARTPDPNRVGDVWVVDTESNDVRRLTGLAVNDLEWSPVATELAIAGDGVSLYSVTSDETRFLGGAEAGQLGWSPDGQTIAFTRTQPAPRDDVHQLLLMDADGTNERILVPEFRANHGLGPVWSPDGDRIAYQRLCDQRPHSPGTPCREEHEVVVVTVNDDDSQPAGTQVVMPPPQTTGRDGPMWWYPYSVTWSPDGTALLYLAWPEAEPPPSVPNSGLVAVRVDGDTPPVLLSGDLTAAVYSAFPWLPIQSWGPQPAPNAPSPGLVVDDPPASTVTTNEATNAPLDDTPPSTAASPSDAESPTTSAQRSVGSDPGSWPTYTSTRYDFTVSHPTDWTEVPSSRDWNWETDIHDPLSPAHEAFISPDDAIRVTAWNAPFDSSAPDAPIDDLVAWVEDYCERSADAPCTGIADRAVELCLEARDCHPGLLVPFRDNVQAFFSGGIYSSDAMTIVAVWHGESDLSVTPYGGAQRLLESILSTMEVWPATTPSSERE